MAATTTNLTIRMDTELKAQAEELFGELGMNLTTAIQIFIRQSLRTGGIPFEVRLDRPNRETAAAVPEAERTVYVPGVERSDDLKERSGN